MIADYLVERKITLPLDGESYPKLRLGKFFRLRKLRKIFFDSLRGDKERFKKALKEIIHLQSGKEIKETDSLYKSIVSALEIFRFNEFENPPVALLPPPKPTVDKTISGKKSERWEYDGQYQAEWINHFAGVYGWSLDEILNLDIDIAGYLLQEIFLEQQFQKEWEYNLSEMAYEYDSHTKKSTHKPLKRPYWMNDAVDLEIKKTKLLRSMLPVGNIVDLAGIGVISANVETGVQTETQKE